MGYRRSEARKKAGRAWAAFVVANRKVIEAAGLPFEVTESIEQWDNFLVNGHIDENHHAPAYNVDQLSDTQYDALLQIVESYFAVGYEYFTPTVLHVEDLQRLDMQYTT